MHLMPIVWVTDMATSRAFYEKLGLDLGEGIVVEDFGRYLGCYDPDGNWVQINEHPRDVT